MIGASIEYWRWAGYRDARRRLFDPPAAARLRIIYARGYRRGLRP